MFKFMHLKKEILYASLVPFWHSFDLKSLLNIFVVKATSVSSKMGQLMHSIFVQLEVWKMCMNF